MTARRGCAAALLVLLALLAGCTGVPDSSSPQTVGPVRVDPRSGAVPTPQRGAGGRQIVNDFLAANATSPGQDASARAFLTKATSTQWSDTKVTIIADEQIGTFDSRTGRIEVTGRVVGTIDQQGEYNASLGGTGNGGAETPFPFALTRVGGQYRIAALRSGLLITVEQFQDSFQQHVLYFDDLSGSNLVPDLRWTAVPSTDTVQLARWLVLGLSNGPRDELAGAVSPTFPTQATPGRVLVRQASDGGLSVEIPGSSQLSASARDALAAQLARTLEEIGETLTITDDGAPVRIPQTGSASFDLASLAPNSVSSPSAGQLYYLDNGRLTTDDGHPVSGPLGTGKEYLNSVALQQRSTASSLSVAAVESVDNTARLAVGTTTAGLVPTTVAGATTRPAWAPNLSEVWVGVGTTLHRVTVHGTKFKDSTVALPPIAGAGRILSVRISPDGARIALVIAPADASAGQLYLGTIERDGSTVQIPTTSLVAISPAGVEVTDADWNTSLRLAAIGYIKPNLQGSVFDTRVDGASWDNRGIGTLPEEPMSITSSDFGTWVDAGSQVWEQNGSGWSSPSSTGQSLGYAPTYVTS